jgi:hypothetical protein
MCCGLLLLLLCFPSKIGERFGIEIIGRWLLGVVCEPRGSVPQLRALSFSLLAEPFQLDPVTQPFFELAKICELEHPEQRAAGRESRTRAVAPRIRVLTSDTADNVLRGISERKTAFHYSAASWVGTMTFSRIVTNSSAALGWMPTVWSNCFLVAPHLIAIASP